MKMEQNGLDRTPKRKAIIDPTSTEVNRGSFCYLPYIYFSAIRRDIEVDFYENFTVAEINDLPPISNYRIALWSYPQIDACLVLNKFLPGEKKFFGYTPLIKALKLPLHEIDNNVILIGMTNYPSTYRFFKYLLLSDCDMHLKEYPGQVYPLFTSYGCPRGCAFCSSTVNCKKRIVIDTETVCSMLRQCYAQDIKNIHFTDEDFFFDTDRAYHILKFAQPHGFKFIALAEVNSLKKFIDKYGNEALTAGGIKLIEVGLETADESLGKKMGKHPISQCLELEKMCDVPIFWLTMTFFPGETLETLNKTGQFLRRHGFNLDELYGRIRTNGTEGGLGQFFQPYHGTKNYSLLKQQGKFISSRPIRLIPSYLPNSFLNDTMNAKNTFDDKEHTRWFHLYNLIPNDFLHNMGFNNITVKENIKKLVKTGMTVADAATGIAILARLNII
jgi:hypothetical protein